MNFPLVSVIMTAYNHEKYIDEAINSVLAQNTDFKYELLIGEDCSTDRTRQTVFDYQKKHPDIIKVITSEENVGMNKNYNRILKAARGKYIAHCEGDDFWSSPNKLRKQVDIMESDPDIAICFHNVNFFYQDDGRTHKQYPWRFRDRYFPVADMILSGGKFQKEVSMMIRRSVLENPPDWYFGAPVTDWAVSLLAGLRGRIYYTNEVMATYRAGVPQSWTDKMVRNPSLYKEHLVKSMHTRKLADTDSHHQYQKYFGRRIGRDIRWLMMFNELSDEEFAELEKEFFSLLSSYYRTQISFMRSIRIEKFITFLRKIKKKILP